MVRELRWVIVEIRVFRVERFRSISTASLDLRNLTVLVGPNNEGKSNILRAMVLGMDALAGFARADTGPKYQLRTGLSGPVDYEWERDFPLQSREGAKKTTVLEFEFQLSEPEIEEFASIIGSKINGNLRVRVTLSRDGSVVFRAIKQKVGAAWTEKADEIAQFVGRRVGVEYVPSVRTAEEAGAVVTRLVALELRTLEEDDDYRNALATIRDLQQLRLDEIALSVQETLEHFLPEVRSVEISLPETRRRTALARAVEIVIDDGHRTTLDVKGDGVQSLAAVALLRRAAMDRSRSRTFVFAVEEPEAHLHPRAIRELRRVLAQIAEDQQVVVTTHSPLLADPLHVDRNVIVEASRARAAQDISEVRDCLGVRLEDNLQSARLALVVEGMSDVKIFRALLADADGALADDLAAGTLVIEGLGGGGKLSYRLSQYASGVCGVFVVLDQDGQGESAARSALDDGLLDEADYRLTVALGKKEAELEDLIDPDTYLAELNTYLGLLLTKSEIRKGKQKWSARLSTLVTNKGKLWNSSTESKVKTIVADAVVANPSSALDPNDQLIPEIVSMLSSRLHPNTST